VRKSASAFALPAIALTLAIAGCGGGSGSTSPGTSPAAAPGGGQTTTVAPNPEESSAAFVSLGSAPKLGLVLVDSDGRTLYGFEGDGGGRSSCYGACARAWPPLLTEGAPQPSNGTSAAKLGTTHRKDGRTQVTYAGHPLYAYSGDHGPGEANGEGAAAFGGRWFALKGSGRPAG
jgi:predicted lipoprotein with Yx(FWY)xxD motif